MKKKDLEKEQYTSEDRLKIKEIKKLKRKNRILSGLRTSGLGMCLYIYYLSFVSLFGEGFGIKSDFSKLFIIFIMIITHIDKKEFKYGIPRLQQTNNELIIELQNELEKNNEEELERVK